MANKGNISEEKARRIAVGATVAGVLLILFLVIIIIVQFVQIGVGNARKAKFDQEIEQYKELIETGENNLEWYKNSYGLYYTARQYGWR